MSKRITAIIMLHFTKDGIDPNMGAEVKTGDIPASLIIESLNNLVKGMAENLVREAIEDGIATYEDQADYLQGLINLDREKLKQLFK